MLTLLVKQACLPGVYGKRVLRRSLFELAVPHRKYTTRDKKKKKKSSLSVMLKMNEALENHRMKRSNNNSNNNNKECRNVKYWNGFRSAAQRLTLLHLH